jgi:tripartite-type tricarboxylate transporter receptor subunit TctC
MIDVRLGHVLVAGTAKKNNFKGRRDMKFIGRILAASAVILSGFGYAGAQTYPTQTIRMVVPFSPGSATDIFARIISDDLTRSLGQQVVVENRPGLAGTVAVAQAPADGYTLMLTSNGHTIAKIVNKAIPFDPVADFSGITRVASVPLVLIAFPELPVKTLPDLIKLAKDKPGELNFASPGLGSSTFIAGALFRDAAKIDVQHIPYKGAPESVTSVMRGDSQYYFNPANVGADLIETGKVRAIAMATAQRVDIMKDVPTMKEQGLDFVYDSWFGIMVRSGTPKPIIDKLNGAIVKILSTPETKEKLIKQGAIPVSDTPEQFDAIIKSDTERLNRIFGDAPPK